MRRLWRRQVGRVGRVVALAAAVGGMVACGAESSPESDGPPLTYAAATLDGDSVSVDELRGQVVLLNVWATWCAPCRREIPELQALHEAHADRGLRVVGVTVDSRHAEEDVRAFIDEFGMTYDIWWDPDQRIVDRLEAVGVPVTVLLDRDGRVAWRHLGAFERGDPELLEAVERTLGAESAGAPAA